MDRKTGEFEDNCAGLWSIVAQMFEFYEAKIGTSIISVYPSDTLNRGRCRLGVWENIPAGEMTDDDVFAKFADGLAAQLFNGDGFIAEVGLAGENVHISREDPGSARPTASLSRLNG